MARLDVFRLPGGALALDCQADSLSHLDTRFTVPLLPLDQLPDRLAGLHPDVQLSGETLVMATHLAGAIPARAMTARIGSLRDCEYIVQRALDTLSGSY